MKAKRVKNVKKQNLFKVLLAFILIVVGVLLILSNIGVISLEIGEVFVYIYPILILIIGLKAIVDDLRGVGGSWQFGTISVVFGGLLTLDRFDVINFSFWDIWNLWPLVLIFIGISIFSPSSGKPEVHITTENGTEKVEAKKAKRNFSVGDHKFDQPNWNVEPMDLWNAIGDYRIDFTKAFIPEKDTPITISGLIGDVNIIMPENIAFKIDASIKAGDIKVLNEKADGINRRLHYKTPDYDEATRRISLQVDFKLGDIRVDKV